MSNKPDNYGPLNAGKILFQSWTSQELNPSYTHMNFPPLVMSQNSQRTMTSEFQEYKGMLTFLSDLGSIIGAAFFSTGSIMGYGLAYGFVPLSWGWISCELFRSIMALIGGIFFTVAPGATFILTDAISCDDKSLTM